MVSLDDTKGRQEDIRMQQQKREKQADYFLEFLNMIEKEKGMTDPQP